MSEGYNLPWWGKNYVYAQCGHKWPIIGVADGDAVILIKDLKIKRICLASGDHEVDCKSEASNMLLKASFLKRA